MRITSTPHLGFCVVMEKGEPYEGQAFRFESAVSINDGHVFVYKPRRYQKSTISLQEFQQLEEVYALAKKHCKENEIRADDIYDFRFEG